MRVEGHFWTCMKKVGWSLFLFTSWVSTMRSQLFVCNIPGRKQTVLSAHGITRRLSPLAEVMCIKELSYPFLNEGCPNLQTPQWHLRVILSLRIPITNIILSITPQGCMVFYLKWKNSPGSRPAELTACSWSCKHLSLCFITMSSHLDLKWSKCISVCEMTFCNEVWISTSPKFREV